MSLQSNLASLITAIGTDYKTIVGNIGTLSSLTTTAKTSLVAAINEVKATAPVAATETTAGVAQVATQTEVNAVTIDTDMVTPLKLGVYLGANYQPLDSDLTALAALTTTSYGRAFNALANQAALIALFPATSETVVGLSRFATQTETNTGTSDLYAVTPLKFQTRLAAYAQPLAANLTALAGFTTDTDTALAAASNTRLATQAAVKAYADGLLDANNAMQYKGVIDCSANPNYPAASAGWTYKVSVAGKIGGASGINVEVGDTLICLVDSSASNTQALVGANWNILQTNIDGAVTGPASSTAADFATFSGSTGKIVQDSGLSLSTDGTFAANLDTLIPSQKAVKTYVAAFTYSQTALGDPTTDLAGLYTTAKT
jgi:hypothetical protein